MARVVLVRTISRLHHEKAYESMAPCTKSVKEWKGDIYSQPDVLVDSEDLSAFLKAAARWSQRQANYRDNEIPSSSSRSHVETGCITRLSISLEAQSLIAILIFAAPSINVNPLLAAWSSSL
jgi:hypothetical protein